MAEDNPYSHYFERMRDMRHGVSMSKLSRSDKMAFVEFLRYLVADVDGEDLNRWVSKHNEDVFTSAGLTFCKKRNFEVKNLEEFKDACASLTYNLNRFKARDSVESLLKETEE